MVSFRRVQDYIPPSLLAGCRRRRLRSPPIHSRYLPFPACAITPCSGSHPRCTDATDRRRASNVFFIGSLQTLLPPSATRLLVVGSSVVNEELLQPSVHQRNVSSPGERIHASFHAPAPLIVGSRPRCTPPARCRGARRRAPNSPRHAQGCADTTYGRHARGRDEITWGFR